MRFPLRVSGSRRSVSIAGAAAPCVVGLVLLTSLVGCGSGGGGGNNQPQPSASPTASGTPSSNPTPVPSASPTGVASPLPSPTATVAPTPDPTVDPTPTPVSTPTPTPTGNPTPDPNPTATPTPTPAPVSIVLRPDTATVSPLGAQQFTPFVGNTSDLGITYGIVEGASGGTINGDGLYTAPLTPGTFHLTITSHADPTKTATATITVASQVSITPSAQTLTVGGTIAFSASVPGANNQAVTWRVLETGGGMIDASGLYTPPTAPKTSGVYHIVATSVEDPAKSGVATVTFQTGGAKGGLQ